MPFSPNHRIFRCLGLAGPRVLFSLNSYAGPTRQLHTFFLLPREPPPLTHQTAAARAQLHRARATPAPHLHRLHHALNAPVSPALRQFLATPPLTAATNGLSTRVAPPAPLLWRFHRDSSPVLSSLHLWFEHAQGVREFAPKGFLRFLSNSLL